MGTMSEVSRLVRQAKQNYNAAEAESRLTDDPRQDLIMALLMEQNELLRELIGRTTPV